MSKFHKFISKKHLKTYVMEDSSNFPEAYKDFNTSEIYTYNNIKKLMFKDDNIIIKNLPIINDLFEVSKNQYETFMFQPEDYIILKSLKNISKVHYQLIMFKMNRLFDEIHSKNVKQAVDW